MTHSCNESPCPACMAAAELINGLDEIPYEDRHTVYSWKDVSDEIVTAFTSAVLALRSRMLPLDCDGDEAIEVEFVDRRKGHMSFYQPTPYYRGGDDPKAKKAHEKALLDNLSTAVHEWKTFKDHEEFIERHKFGESTT